MERFRRLSRPGNLAGLIRSLGGHHPVNYRQIHHIHRHCHASLTSEQGSSGRHPTQICLQEAASRARIFTETGHADACGCILRTSQTTYPLLKFTASLSVAGRRQQVRSFFFVHQAQKVKQLDSSELEKSVMSTWRAVLQKIHPDKMASNPEASANNTYVVQKLNGIVKWVTAGVKGKQKLSFIGSTFKADVYVSDHSGLRKKKLNLQLGRGSKVEQAERLVVDLSNFAEIGSAPLSSKEKSMHRLMKLRPGFESKPKMLSKEQIQEIISNAVVFSPELPLAAQQECADKLIADCMAISPTRWDGKVVVVDKYYSITDYSTVSIPCEYEPHLLAALMAHTHEKSLHGMKGQPLVVRLKEYARLHSAQSKNSKSRDSKFRSK